MSYYKVRVSRFISLTLSVCFLFALVAPTFTLLASENDELSIILIIEKETQNKDLEEVNDFSELDFDINVSSEIVFLKVCSSNIHWFFNYNIKANDLKNTSPPPDFS
jgi:predicted PurR-regulated permease PerM